MKRTSLILLFTILFQWSVAQTTYTANNNPGAVTGANIFTGAMALQDAVAAASAGDFIYVVRGHNDYGTVTIDKQLSIFGVGLNPDTNGLTRSVVSTVNITDPLASGTRISGLWITAILNIGGVVGSLNNIMIENCNIFRIDHISGATTLTNIIIRNNVLGSGNTGTQEAISLLAGSVSLIVIANNIICGPSSASHGVGALIASNGTSIINNLFIGKNSAVNYAFQGLSGSSVKNNIFYGLQPHGGISSNVFENNISYNTGNGTTDIFSTSNGNISIGNLEGVNPILVNVPFSVTIDFSTFDGSLGVGSQAELAGTDGTDMGVFGGGSPFDVAGAPLPLVQEITAPPTISQGSDLPINIKGKGN